MNLPTRQLVLVLATVLCLVTAALADPVSPFASDPPVSYTPAWGFYVNCYLDEEGLPTRQFGDPRQAVGAPTGEGTNPAGNPDHVTTLGAYGGSITLKFDHTVRHDETNPFGMDAIVFGNALRTGSNVFMEPGAIEISRDANNNGIADDQWYIIPGSHMSAPPSSTWTLKTWSKSGLSVPAYYPDKTSLYGAVWYPNYPDPITLGAYKLPSNLVQTPSQLTWGYADCSPALRLGDMNGDNSIDDTTVTPEEFYTNPDDPQTSGITLGSCGGDAFRIAWAVDSAGHPANLDGFDFIRITTAVDAMMYATNECSTEVDAVADVSPMPENVNAAKSHPNGAGVHIQNAIVTAAYTGEFYIQQGRFFGIKVKSSAAVQPGDRVNVIGTISSSGGERFVCSFLRDGTVRDAFVRIVDHNNEVPGPAGLPNVRLGGGSLNAATPGVTGGVGVNNIGLLVRTWGVVKSVGSNCFYVSDSSMPEGETLKVSPGVPPSPNPRMVQITGVSSCELDNGVSRRVLRPLPQNGILGIQ